MSLLCHDQSHFQCLDRIEKWLEHDVSGGNRYTFLKMSERREDDGNGNGRERGAGRGERERGD